MLHRELAAGGLMLFSNEREGAGESSCSSHQTLSKRLPVCIMRLQQEQGWQLQTCSCIPEITEIMPAQAIQQGSSSRYDA